MSERILATYAETCQFIRHYDTLKYTCWTVYTAIIAGLYVAKSSNEISNFFFVILIGETSLFFCFLLTRIQINYKIYCHTAEKLESILRDDELNFRHVIDRDGFRVGPFDVGANVLPGNFNKRTIFERVFGIFPYFTLHISFFVGIFLTFLAAYLILPGDSAKSHAELLKLQTQPVLHPTEFQKLRHSNRQAPAADDNSGGAATVTPQTPAQ